MEKNDVVEIFFEMTPRTVKARYEVEADRGKVAIERGPIVFCAEWPDNSASILSTTLSKSPKFTESFNKDKLGGIMELATDDAQVLSYNEEGKIVVEDVKLNMIPYYAWAHRGEGEMAVWLADDLIASRPIMPPSIASKSKTTASYVTKSILAINDRLIPKNEFDRSVPYFQWWPKKASTEWIAYEFEEETEISSTSVYWYDDGPWGGCRVPKAWKLSYMNDKGEWIDVKNKNDYGVVKGENNLVLFEPIKTKNVKIEIQLPDDNSAGIFEWDIE